MVLSTSLLIASLQAPVPRWALEAFDLQRRLVAVAAGSSRFDTEFRSDILSLVSREGSPGFLARIKIGTEDWGYVSTQSHEFSRGIAPNVTLESAPFSEAVKSTLQNYFGENEVRLREALLESVPAACLATYYDVSGTEWVSTLRWEQTTAQSKVITVMFTRFIGDLPTADHVVVRVNEVGVVKLLMTSKVLRERDSSLEFRLTLEDAKFAVTGRRDPTASVLPILGIPTMLQGTRGLPERIQAAITNGTDYPIYQVTVETSATIVAFVDGLTGEIIATREITGGRRESGKMDRYLFALESGEHVLLHEAVIPDGVRLEHKDSLTHGVIRVECRSDEGRRWILVAWPDGEKAYRLIKPMS
ncbi:MAG: hypothetical protein KF812_08215 [Fimbriimonadaceae bacterium]|nr:hypothetical protein [Fimbriimonadaceae bacterium]